MTCDDTLAVWARGEHQNFTPSTTRTKKKNETVSRRCRGRGEIITGLRGLVRSKVQMTVATLQTVCGERAIFYQRQPNQQTVRFGYFCVVIVKNVAWLGSFVIIPPHDFVPVWYVVMLVAVCRALLNQCGSIEVGLKTKHRRQIIFCRLLELCDNEMQLGISAV